MSHQAPLLDTHVWIWWILGSHELDAGKANYLDSLPAESRPFLSDISLWEIALLVDRGRLQLEQPLNAFLRDAASSETVQLCRIGVETVAAMNRLPDSFHCDPADWLIVATAISRGLKLASFDRLIVESGLVSIWQ